MWKCEKVLCSICDTNIHHVLYRLIMLFHINYRFFFYEKEPHNHWSQLNGMHTTGQKISSSFFLLLLDASYEIAWNE